MEKQRVLKTDSELSLCILKHIPIEIHMEGSVEYTGEILGFNESCIHVPEGFYLRDNCTVYFGKC
ncbi:hypothetical protein WMW72_20350 [Paenibacillus filicis]|uniref:DUF5348 domain-containing protein n=1 Tax=Paenibacillus filicis TaxID=669464 RepID=A0ABU9DN14_9BACL